MTLRDYMKKHHPESVNEFGIGGVNGCPQDYEFPFEIKDICSNDDLNGEECTACWNREIDYAEKETLGVEAIKTMIRERLSAISLRVENGHANDLEYGAITALTSLYEDIEDKEEKST